MAAPRTKTKRELDRQEAVRLHLLGFQYEQIAEILGISEPTVGADLRAVEERWKQSTLVDFDAARQRELESVSMVVFEAWQSWEASKGKNKQGDSRYLPHILKGLEQRCKLLGLYPKDSKGSDPTLFSADQLKTIAQLFGAANEFKPDAQDLSGDDDQDEG